MSLLLAALFGVGLGIVTGMPIGVVNVAIVDAASRGARRFATGIGIGGALADGIHAAVAFVGVGRVLASRPELMRGFAIAAACLIVGYAIATWRRREAKRVESDRSSLSRGFVTGLLFTLPNPGALAAWVAVAASAWPHASGGEAIALALGVVVGSAAWFAALAHWIASVRSDHPALSIIPKVALAVLVVIAIVGVLRAF